MKPWILAAAMSAVLWIAAPVASAKVVVVRAWAPAPAVAGPYGYGEVLPYAPPYSYYATFPWPARGYVGYGPTDMFPFHGRAYGHPYDPWTWAYMGGGGYSRYLPRYYYPPVP